MTTYLVKGNAVKSPQKSIRLVSVCQSKYKIGLQLLSSVVYTPHVMYSEYPVLVQQHCTVQATYERQPAPALAPGGHNSICSRQQQHLLVGLAPCSI